ncbi:MAG: DUF4062 domain-containing protein [Candidatus Limnocylindrales bacterium]
MRVFISSVRHGLEEERDALPALIRAIGHEPRRFEDYTAQPVPSRDACLRGVEESDAYVLLLGEHYGDKMPDTGTSPTEEEWVVARRRGIPILAFRKRDVGPDADQAAFIRRIEDYAVGVFRESFSTTAQLLTAVATTLREVAAAPPALVWRPLGQPVNVPWKAFGQSVASYATVLEIHLIPTAGSPLPATTLEALPRRLSRVGRDHGLFSEDRALDLVHSEAGAAVTTRADRQAPMAGLRMAGAGGVTIWTQLPSDTLGVLLDAHDLGERIGTGLRIGAELLPSTGEVALAVGLFGGGLISEGSVAELGRRTTATITGFRRGAASAQVEPRDAVPAVALGRAADEIARELASRLLLRFRDV